MANFDTYAPKLRKWEGGWSDNPNDAGGATMAGVTLATYRRYFGQGKTKADLRKITDAEWQYIMRRYWDNCKADGISNQSLAELFVDWHVNAGAWAIKNAQKALGLQADGIVGPKTLAALNADARLAFGKVKAARIGYYTRIGKGKNAAFLRGWLNRTNDFTFKNQ